jgi:1-deoxy-D-xylulose-5-phosphate reductoisomerase
MTKKIAILGSTGSIGIQALEVCSHLGIEVVSLAAGSNIALLEEQVRRCRPKMAAVADEALARLLAVSVADTGTRVAGGTAALLEAATLPEIDMVLISVVGSAGLAPTVAALKAGKRIALANKETLVAGGSLIMALARERNLDILPVDSEHSALFQSLAGNRPQDVEKLLLTASGGPFRGYSAEALERVTREQALKHPNWSMGSKITVDSATMMNKGLEVIEAHWLFDVPVGDIEVLVHPQSIIHSLVAYRDGSVMAQLGATDMRIPIQLAMTWPERHANPFRRLSLTEAGNLAFEQPDMSVFRCLPIAYGAIRRGGTMPAAMNAANEAAVEAFLGNRLKFARIPDVVQQAMERHVPDMTPTLESIADADREGRARAAEALRKLSGS